MVMEQLQSHLNATNDTSTLPVDRANLVFWASDEFELKSHISPLLPNYTTITRSSNPYLLLIEAKDSHGNPLAVSKTNLSVSAVDAKKNTRAVQLKETNSSLELHMEQGTEVVEVKLQGSHINGSPFLCSYWTWSPTNKIGSTINNKTLTSIASGAYGMIEQELDMNPRTLAIKILHFETNGWAQIGLFASNTVAPPAGYNLNGAIEEYNIFNMYRTNGAYVKGTTTKVMIEREVNGDVALFVNQDLKWRKQLPRVYVYIDIFHPTTAAEIM